MSSKKRFIWVTLFLTGVVSTYYSSVYPWLLPLYIPPFLYGMYLLITYNKDFEYNKPWGIAYFILIICCLKLINRSIDETGELVGLDNTAIIILKIILGIATVFILKYLFNKRNLLNSAPH